MAQFDSSITAYFGGDTSGLQNAVNEAGGMMGTLSSKMEERFVGMRHLSMALATALGLNIADIAKNIAGLVTGLSEESRKSLEKLGELSTQLADANIKQMREKATLENQLILATQDENKTQEKLLSNIRGQSAEIDGANRSLAAQLGPLAMIINLVLERSKTEKQLAEQVTLTAEQIKNTAEVTRLTTEEKSKQETIAGQLLQYAKIENDNAAKSLDYAGQLSVLNDTLVAAKIKLADSEAGSVEQGKALLDVQKARMAIYEVERQYLKEQSKLFDERDKATGVYAKMLFDQKTKEEQIVILQREARVIKEEMSGLNKDSTLYMQDAVELSRIEKQIRESQIPVEKSITDEIERQAKIKRDLAALNASQVTHYGLSNLGDLSTASLQAALEQLQKTMASIVLQYQQSGYGSTGQGGPTGAAAQDNFYLQSQMDSIKQELKFREGFSSAYSKGGAGGAMGFYTGQGGNALSFDNALSGMSSWGAGQDQSAKTLTSISTGINALSGQLAASGLFPATTNHG